MSPRCQVCGEYESEDTSIISGHDVCYECVDRLVENEVERRGERAEAQAFSSYHSGTAPFPFTDAERQQEQARIQRERR